MVMMSNSNTTKDWEARSVDRDSRVEQCRLHEHQLDCSVDFGLVFVVSLLANVSIDLTRIFRALSNRTARQWSLGRPAFE